MTRKEIRAQDKAVNKAVKEELKATMISVQMKKDQMAMIDIYIKLAEQDENIKQMLLNIKTKIENAFKVTP